MKHFATYLTLLCVLMTAPVQALQITDDRGVTVTFAQTPRRIVSLLPSLTETVCELGECSRLVGVARHSGRFVPSVRQVAPR